MTYLRGRDMKVEREVARFLDMHLYTNPIFTKSERTDDLDKQMKGSDIIVSIPSLNIKDAVVDEKAITHYINRDIPTFAFELSFLTASEELVEGWLTDKEKITEYYLCVWLKAIHNWNIVAEDIIEADCILLERKKLLDYLKGQGLTTEVLQKKCLSIREEGKNGPLEKTNSSKYYFYYTTNLKEKPVNIIVRKALLIDLATCHWTITLDYSKSA